MTHYEVLGVRKTATTDEIKDAYKKLVKKYHPDVYVGDKTFAEKKIKEINAAYDVLSDPLQKREYDDLISPQTTTNYTPPDYSGYTYTSNSSYSQTGTSKRNAEAQGSKYSYENYKKTYNSQGAYDYQRRYTNYHRSKTPNSNYSGNNPNVNTVTEETVVKISNASKLFIIALIFIFYIIFFISSLLKLSDIFGSSNSSNPSTSSTQTPSSSVDDDSYTYTSPKTYEDYNNNKYSNETDEEIVTEENFDINNIYSDSELQEVYNEYFTQIYPTFEEFKQAMSDYYYQTYYQNYQDFF